MDSDATRTSPVTRRDDRGRYELEIDGEIVAFAEFSREGDLITIPYIETDPRYRERGHSAALMSEVVADLRAHDLRVRATCSVARGHISRLARELLVS